MNSAELAQRLAVLQQWMGREIASQQATLYAEQPWPTPRLIADGTVVIDPANDKTYPSLNPNRVEHLGTAGLVSKPILSEIVELYRSARASRFFVYVSPSAQATDLERWLLEAGIVKVNELSVMWRPAAFLGRPDCEFDIRITRPAHAEVLRKVVNSDDDQFGYAASTVDMLGKTGFFTMHASCQEDPVATGSLYVHQRLAYLGNGKTLGPYRNQGAQSALIAARVGLASALGCTDAVSETYRFLATSFGNLQRAGFTELYCRSIYRWENLSNG